MARKTKKEMAEILKRNGYFSKYKYVCDIVKKFSWQDLKCYYTEMLHNQSYPN